MFRRKRRPSDFGSEIEAHLQFETERNARSGSIAPRGVKRLDRNEFVK